VAIWLMAALSLSAQTPAPTRSAPVSNAAGGVIPVTAADILRLVRESPSRAVVVNIWATWCEPCIEEFPALLRLRRDYQSRGLKLILVSADFDTELPQVGAFLERQKVDFPTYFKSEKDQEFINSLSADWSGALPATFLYDRNGKLLDFWQGQFSYATLEQKVREILDQNAQP
jgi:thiol-disulfide isomerase/thioredoxin